MAIQISNTTLSKSWFYLIERVNEMAAGFNRVITVNSNTAIGDASISGSFVANTFVANTIRGGSISTPAALKLGANLDLNGNQLVGNVTLTNATLAGNTAIANVAISGTTAFTGNVSATRPVTLANTLSVTGDASFTANTQMSGTANINVLKAASANVSGDAEVKGNFVASTGRVTLPALANVYFSSVGNSTTKWVTLAANGALVIENLVNKIALGDISNANTDNAGNNRVFVFDGDTGQAVFKDIAIVANSAGIGNTWIQSNNDIYSVANVAVGYIPNALGGGVSNTTLDVRARAASGERIGTFTHQNTASAGHILISTGNAVTGSVRFGDTESGNVGRVEYLHSNNSLQLYANGNVSAHFGGGGFNGFGLATPAYRVHLKSTAATATVLALTAFSNNNLLGTLGEVATGGTFQLYDAAGVADLRLTAAATSYFNSNVAIGKTSAAYPLDVSGTISGSAVLSAGAPVWTSNNDGTGSGLDADVVRGTTPSVWGLERFTDANVSVTLDALGIPDSLALKANTAGGVFTGAVAVNSTFSAFRAATFSNTIAVTGSATFGSTMSVNGEATFGAGIVSTAQVAVKASNTTQSPSLSFQDSTGAYKGSVLFSQTANALFISIGASPGVYVYSNGAITFGTDKLWHAGNDGTSSGLDADLVRNTTPSTAGLAILAAANVAVMRTQLSLVPGTDVLPQSAFLANVAAASANGIIIRSGSGSLTRSIANGPGIIISNGDGTTGNPTVAADFANTSQYWSRANNKIVSADIAMAAAKPIQIPYASTIKLEPSTGINFEIGLLTGPLTLNFGTDVGTEGRTGSVSLTQDATGGRAIAFDAKIKWDSGTPPTIPTTGLSTVIINYKIWEPGWVVCSAMVDVR